MTRPEVGATVEMGAGYAKAIGALLWRDMHPERSRTALNVSANDVVDAISRRETVSIDRLRGGRRLTSVALARVVRQVLPTLLGFAVGVFFILTSKYRGAPQWETWAVLWIAQTATAGAVFTFGMNRWRELPGKDRPPAAARTALLIVLFGCAALTAGLALPVWHHYGWKGPATVAVCLAGAVPAAVTVLLVRWAAHCPSWPASRGHGEQASWILDRHRLLKSLLATVGSLVALQMLTLGALGEVRRGTVAPGELRASSLEPPVTMVIAGAIGSLVIGVVYALAAVPLRARGRELSAQMFGHAVDAEPKALLAQLEDRQKFEKLLGADAGLFSELQSNLFVLGPLVASGASTFFAG
jgi:hypothetical protein